MEGKSPVLTEKVIVVAASLLWSGKKFTFYGCQSISGASFFVLLDEVNDAYLVKEATSVDERHVACIEFWGLKGRRLGMVKIDTETLNRVRC